MRAIIRSAVVVFICVLAGGYGIVPARAQGEGAGKTKVVLVQAPVGAIAPDVVLFKGVLYMVYGLDKDAFFVKSFDSGKTWSAPVKLNGDEGVTTTMGERGPKLAIGNDNVIHVVWQDFWQPDAKVYVRYTRSQNRGRSFDKPRAVSEMSGVDGATIASDGEGHVAVFWHCADDRTPSAKAATWLYLARSDDSGATFGKSEPVHVTGHTGLACSMCQMRARLAIDGKTVFLVFRSAERGIRDPYLLRGAIADNSFTAVRVCQTNWKLDTCPMNGPELTIDSTGRPLVAFMSYNHVYYCFADKEAKNGFGTPIGTPNVQQDEIYPTAVMNKKFETLLIWQVGPMSTTGTAVVKGAIYNMPGVYSGRSATIGTTSSGTKATAFVGGDDNFYIVTTTKKK